MIGLRQKLGIGFGALLLVTVVIGGVSISQLHVLGRAIDVIMKENYRSVIACGDMKEALERMDSGALFTMLGDEDEGNALIDANRIVFEKALQTEISNVTLPGEGEKAAQIQKYFAEYVQKIETVRNGNLSMDQRRLTYFDEILPLFQQIKSLADTILTLNQENMASANRAAGLRAAAARHQMYMYLLAGFLIAVVSIVLVRRWVLRPIQLLTDSVRDIQHGTLEVVVPTVSNDELGQLTAAFNEMASKLREFRRSERLQYIRVQRATQEAFSCLPEAIAVVNEAGEVEIATPSAQHTFGLTPHTLISQCMYPWIADTFHEVLREGRAVQGSAKDSGHQFFVNGEERFYRPKGVPMIEHDEGVNGVIMVLEDVTQLRQQVELKRGVISTVSHQLRTPLTAIRMAVHLLLEEKVGPLNPKQTDLLLAARDEGSRLSAILEDLLDISRIESGRALLDLRPIAPSELAFNAIERHAGPAKDRGISLVANVAVDLPEALADATRIAHVFDNLITNALKYTMPGGAVTIAARCDAEFVTFSISDTGCGIPEEYRSRIFDPFFRVPGQDKSSGVGLGLAIVKEIVVAHGGTVTASSGDGAGSVFTFTLRRADAPESMETS
ncbi:MAG: HAMP domain-containing protein [Candidatus Hydrogenedentes bacterium]|nr:HAMP domain-containing protein [Candidatus Hydrogenedentota bacterium]